MMLHYFLKNNLQIYLTFSGFQKFMTKIDKLEKTNSPETCQLNLELELHLQLF